MPLSSHECPECGETVSRFAPECPECNAPNPTRTRLAIAVAVVSLLAAAGVLTALLWQWRPGSEQQQAQGTDAFEWLTTAMDACENDAAQNPATLYFIVIPMAADPKDVPQWREKSLNDIGNAILLTSAEGLEGLRQNSLTISNEPYVFGIRDQAQVIYKWKPSSGVARFSTPEAESITSFNIQFLTGDKPREADWGAAFARQKGSCYWVTAITGL
jgi:hypothetical protein